MDWSLAIGVEPVWGLGFEVWVGMSTQMLWRLPKHTQTVSISGLNMLHLALLPAVSPHTTKPRTLDSLISVLTDFLELAGNGFYFRKSDQIKIIPIKKCRWASRTASAHHTQNRPTTKFSLPYVLLMAELLPWSLEWFNGVKVVWYSAERILPTYHKTFCWTYHSQQPRAVKESKSDFKYYGTQLSVVYLYWDSCDHQIYFKNHPLLKPSERSWVRAWILGLLVVDVSAYSGSWVLNFHKDEKAVQLKWLLENPS